MRRRAPTSVYPLDLKWRDLTYDAADFTAETGNWNVQSADVRFLRYAILGFTVFLRLSVNDTAITDDTAKLYYQLPDFLIPSISQSPFSGAIVSLAGTHTAGYVEVIADTGVVEIRRIGDTNWTNGNAGVSVNIWFQLR